MTVTCSESFLVLSCRTCWQTCLLNVKICLLKECLEPVMLTRCVLCRSSNQHQVWGSFWLMVTCLFSGYLPGSKLHLQEANEWWHPEPGLLRCAGKGYNFWLPDWFLVNFIAGDITCPFPFMHPHVSAHKRTKIKSYIIFRWALFYLWVFW